MSAVAAKPDPKLYKRVREPKPEEAEKKSEENHVRVVASRGQRMYLKYALEVFNGTEGKTKSDKVILTGMGNAVYNVVQVVEILKRRVKGLYQTTELASETMTDKYEAIEEGKDGIEVSRRVSTIKIVLSTTALDKNHPGFQEPIPEDQVKEGADFESELKDKPRQKKGEKKGGRRGRGEKDAKKGDKKDEKKGDEKKGGRRGRGGDKKDEKKGDKKDDKKGGRRGEAAAAPRRGGRGGRDTRDDRAPARGGRRSDERSDRRAPRRDERDDRAPARGGRGRGGYSEGRREGGRGSGERRDERRSDRGGRRN